MMKVTMTTMMIDYDDDDDEKDGDDLGVEGLDQQLI